MDDRRKAINTMLKQVFGGWFHGDGGPRNWGVLCLACRFWEAAGEVRLACSGYKEP